MRRLMISLMMFLAVTVSGQIPAGTLQVKNGTLGLQQSLSVSVGLSKPYLNSDWHYSSTSGMCDVAFSLPLKGGRTFLFNVPLTRSEYEGSVYYSGDSRADQGAGNVFVGLQKSWRHGSNAMIVSTTGLYLPTASAPGAMMGILSDYLNMQRYMPDVVTFYLDHGFHRISSSGMYWGIGGGGEVLYRTKGEGDKVEVLAHYRIAGGLEGNGFTLTCSVQGIAVITQVVPQFTDRFLHSATLSLGYRLPVVTPVFSYQRYLKDELRDMVSGVLRLELHWAIPR